MAESKNQLQQILDDILQDKNTNLTPDNLKEGVTCLGVKGNLTKLKGQQKIINPTIIEQTVTPDTGYNALTSITVNAVDNSIDSNIQPENIKKNVNILGVTGTLEEGTEINNQNKEITANGTYTADEGYTGLGTVTVNVPNTENILDITNSDTITIEDNTLVIDDNKPYTQISYIQSNNASGISGQFINTKVKAANDIGFEIKLSTQECSTDYPAILYGGSSYTNGSDDEFGYCNRQNQHSAHYQNYKYNCHFNVIPYDQITEISFVNGIARQDGEEISFEGFNEIPEYTSSYDIYLFAANSDFGRDPSPLYFSNAKIYYLKMYKGTQLVRDFIPVIRKSDNAVCLYDKVTKDFYTSGGNGSLIAGV